MKCNKCGNEMNFTSEEYCKDVTGKPLYKTFAKCDNCNIKISMDNNDYIANGQTSAHSNKAREHTSSTKTSMYGKFYLSTWVIALCFAFSFYIFPLIIGVILLVMQIMANSKLKLKYGYIDELDDNIKKKEVELTARINTINSKNKDIHSLDTEIAELKNAKDKEIAELEVEKNNKIKRIDEEIAKLRAEKTKEIQLLKATITELRNEMLSEEVLKVVASLDYTSYDSYTSEECKNELSLIRLKEKEFIKNEYAVKITDSYSKKQSRDNAKQILRCFNAECDNIILSVTLKNIDSLRTKISKSFDTLNKIFAVDGVALNTGMLKFKLQELTLLYEYEKKYAEEREIQKAIKEQMLEEEKVRRELEKRKNEIEKDQKQFNNEVSKLMKYLQKTESDIEKQLYADKIKELEEKIKALETEKSDVINRERNAKAGFVYIISNIGSFGENIYKIGMTRRLEPMDRIKELSSASVPFEFDVHAMIFSEDAPALETTLHQHFNNYRVNKINPRKEFFNISIDEIEEFIDKNYDKTVEFTKIPIAKEYRASLEAEICCIDDDNSFDFEDDFVFE